MPKVAILTFSTYTDHNTGVQFLPELDNRSGCFVGVADVNDETAAKFADRPSFEILSEAEYAAFSQAPPRRTLADVAINPPASTGDPLGDAAAERAASLDPGALAVMAWADLQALARDRNVKVNQSRAALISALLGSGPAGSTSAPASGIQSEGTPSDPPGPVGPVGPPEPPQSKG